VIDLLRNLAVMLQSSWRADRWRTVGALLSTALLPVTRPTRAVGLAVMVDGILSGERV